MNTFFNSRELKDCRRVCIRGALLILPFLVVAFLELFVLPIDFFTFRVWEAALATPYQYPGPYYPNLHVKKQEYGDSYRYGVFESKPLEWYTDSYGWRNRPEIEKRKKYDAIIIGDSNMAGSFLDQKDTLAEVLSKRMNKVVYSYASGTDNISLFFSDPRPKFKTADLLVFELKAGYWFRNNLELQNFKELPDGSLMLRPRTKEFSLANNHLSKFGLNWRKLRSRLNKQPLWHAARAELAVNFFVPSEEDSVVYLGKLNTHFDEKKSWRPLKWIVVNGTYHTLTNEPQPAVSIRGKGYAYWHTEKFQAIPSDGEITVKFQAKNSITSFKHIVYIFEDRHYRSVGKILADNKWRTFEIPIKTKPGSILEFQVDQPNNWQWLSIRDFRIINAKPASFTTTARTMLKNAMHTTAKNETTNDLTSSTMKLSSFQRRPSNLTLDEGERELTDAEIQYYFYHAIKTVQREATARKMDFICFIMPDEHAGRLMPAIKQLRSEGVKVIAYQPTKDEISGVKHKWYWQKADSHWTEAAARLTADEIIRMWKNKKVVANRPFSKLLMVDYAKGFPKDVFHTDKTSLG